MGGGGLWDESQALYREFGGTSRGGNSLDWRFEADARIELRHMLRVEDRVAHHGRQYAFIGFDELQTFDELQFWYLVSRLRSTCGVRPYLRATCNPDPESFVADLIAWWIGEDGYPIKERSGVIRWFVRDPESDELVWFPSQALAKKSYPELPATSFTFIAAKLSDNQILMEKDPTYRAKLLSMTRVDRLRLLGEKDRGGNWLVRPSRGLVFPRRLFKVRNRPLSKPVVGVRAWDKGATAPNAKNRDPDWTRGVRVWLCEQGELWIDDIVSMRERPGIVLRRMAEVAEDDGTEIQIALWQDPGGAGKTDLATTLSALSGFNVESIEATSGVVRGHGGKGRAKWNHAKAWSPLVERGMVAVLEADWTETLIAECDGFPDAIHDDIVDSMSLAWQILGRERRVTLMEAMSKVKGI
jgi:predicted phage terminase large subunit-like protein